MNRGLVVDASMAVGWVHGGQATVETAAILEAMLAGVALEVPALWPLEVANALTVLVRRGKMSAGERRTGLKWLGRLRVRYDHEAATMAFDRLADLAMELRLSVYDAVYLELAERRGLPLGSKDESLRAAARRRGVPLWAGG